MFRFGSLLFVTFVCLALVNAAHVKKNYKVASHLISSFLEEE